MKHDHSALPSKDLRRSPSPVRSMDASAANATSSGWQSSNWSGYAIASNNNGAYTSISASWVVPSAVPQSAPSPTPQPSPSPTPTPTPTPTPSPIPTSPSIPNWLKQLLELLFGTGGFSFDPKAKQALKNIAEQATADVMSRHAESNVQAATSSTDGYSATWIGIDGFNNSNLIQAGTAQNYINGRAEYYAWWEILPAAETEIDPTTYPVQAGDQIHTSITQQPDGTFTITMQNQTHGWTFNKSNINYSGPLTSVEWIEEAPEINGQIAPLADYGTVTFTNCQVNGSNVQLSPSESGVMVQNGTQVSTPSSPGASGNDFSIAYGSTAPNPPSA